MADGRSAAYHVHMPLLSHHARGYVFVALALTVSIMLPAASGALRSRGPQFAWVRMQAPAESEREGGAGDSLRPVEKSFIEKTLETSRNQAEMARLAVSHATSSSVRDFAQQLVGDHGQMNNTLETLARRKSVSVPVQPTSFSDDFRRLAQKSGRAFDREFMQMIATANDTTLRLCEAAISQAKDGDVRDVAGSFLPVVRDHVNKASNLQKSLE